MAANELHKFLFDALPVRGMVVRLGEAWPQILQRRAANSARAEGQTRPGGKAGQQQSHC